MLYEGSIPRPVFESALKVGRPPNIVKLFPNSRALLVSGKFIDCALSAKGGALTIAANCRNHLIIKGVLLAAQRANAAVIVEIARGESGHFIKINGQGVDEALWQEMTAHAHAKGLDGSQYKQLNLPFETRIMGLPKKIRTRIVRRVEAFVHHLLVEVFNAKDSAPLAIEAILEANGPDPGSKAECMEDSEKWALPEIARKAALIDSDKGPEGDFDD